jgi:hypothetical protein
LPVGRLNDATLSGPRSTRSPTKQVSIVTTIGIDQRQNAVKLRHLSVDITEA